MEGKKPKSTLDPASFFLDVNKLIDISPSAIEHIFIAPTVNTNIPEHIQKVYDRQVLAISILTAGLNEIDTEIKTKTEVLKTLKSDIWVVSSQVAKEVYGENNFRKDTYAKNRDVGGLAEEAFAESLDPNYHKNIDAASKLEEEIVFLENKKKGKGKLLTPLVDFTYPRRN